MFRVTGGHCLHAEGSFPPSGAVTAVGGEKRPHDLSTWVETDIHWCINCPDVTMAILAEVPRLSKWIVIQTTKIQIVKDCHWLWDYWTPSTSRILKGSECWNWKKILQQWFLRTKQHCKSFSSPHSTTKEESCEWSCWFLTLSLDVPSVPLGPGLQRKLQSLPEGKAHGSKPQGWIVALWVGVNLGTYERDLGKRVSW